MSVKGNAHSPGEDGEYKRKRVAKACQTCRAMKSKVSATQPARLVFRPSTATISSRIFADLSRLRNSAMESGQPAPDAGGTDITASIVRSHHG